MSDSSSEGANAEHGAPHAAADRRKAAKATDTPPQPSRRRQNKRREQQRSIDTRRAILSAALDEFSERGFDGASIRRIGERAKLDFTLITYHFSNKDVLWRAVAEWGLGEILDAVVPRDSLLTAKERVRVEFLAYFNFTTANPAFHNFMLRSMYGDPERIRWLVENYLVRIRDRMRPQLAEAQAAGEMVSGDPDLLYYLMIGATSALSSLRGEMELTTGYSLEDPKVRAAFWDLIERAFFR
jgi:AcrR family transcriptional regulator